MKNLRWYAICPSQSCGADGLHFASEPKGEWIGKKGLYYNPKTGSFDKAKCWRCDCSFRGKEEIRCRPMSWGDSIDMHNVFGRLVGSLTATIGYMEQMKPYLQWLGLSITPFDINISGLQKLNTKLTKIYTDLQRMDVSDGFNT